MAIATAAAQARALAPLALEATIQAHEVDGASSAMMDHAVQESATLVDDILKRLNGLLEDLKIHSARMQENPELTQGPISAEAVMMKLAERIGRQEAHAIVHHAAVHAASTGKRFLEVLATEPALAGRFATEEIHSLLDPGTSPRPECPDR